MSPPRSVNLAPIRNLYLENIVGTGPNGEIIEDAAIRVLGHDRVAGVFAGTDYYLTKEGNIECTLPSSEPKSGKITRRLSEVASFIRSVKDADLNGDEELTVDEIQKQGLGTLFSAKEDISPEWVLAEIQEMIDLRWGPMAENMTSLSIGLKWLPTLQLLEVYNKGILIEQ